MLTEEEAKTKWCPLSHSPTSEVGDPVSSNRLMHSGKAPLDCLCLASECMAWRKSGQIGRGPNGEKRDRDMDGRTRWIDVGYCGAFGEPKSAR